jgi:Zn-finger nucleic acid-binding protein
VIYRDRPIQCPLCRVDVSRDEARERWRCHRCRGLMLSVAEVAHDLLETAPDLLPSGGVGGLTTLGRHSEIPPFLCGVCGAPMEPVFLGGVRVDRCYHDELLWFDRGELDRVLEIAREQKQARARAAARNWLSRLFL